MSKPPVCPHGYSHPHPAREFTDPLENRVDGSGNPYLGDGYASPCPGPLSTEEVIDTLRHQMALDDPSAWETMDELDRRGEGRVTSQSLWDEQVQVFGTFDEDDSCRICGGHVREFSQILHYHWHQNQEET